MFFNWFLILSGEVRGRGGLGNYVDVVIDKGFYFLCLSLEAKKNAANTFVFLNY